MLRGSPVLLLLLLLHGGHAAALTHATSIPRVLPLRIGRATATNVLLGFATRRRSESVENASTAVACIGAAGVLRGLLPPAKPFARTLRVGAPPCLRETGGIRPAARGHPHLWSVVEALPGVQTLLHTPPWSYP